MKTTLRTLLLTTSLALQGILWASVASSSTDLGIARPSVQGDGARIAPALALWIEHRASEAGLNAVSIEASGSAALQPAVDRELGALLLSQLRIERGEATLQLVLVAPRTGAVLGSSGSSVALEDLGLAAAEGAMRIFSRLGLSPRKPVPVTLDDLMCTSRALKLHAAGDGFGAYEVVKGKLSPLATALREELVVQLSRSESDLATRARVIAATGDPIHAWRLIGADAKAALHHPKPDPELLIAAGEVSLARGDDAGARRYFEAALKQAVRQTAGDAQLGLARVATLQGEPAAARRALTEAVSLRPNDARPAFLLSNLVDDPDASAKYLLTAGERAARTLDTDRARLYLGRAAELPSKHRSAALFARAQLESVAGRPAVALEALEAIPTAEKNPAAQLLLGRAYARLEDTRAARGAYLQALALAPEHPEALRELGALEVAAGQPALALTYLRKAKSQNPEHLSTRRELAAALEANGDSAGAEALRASLAQETNSAEDLGALATSQMTRGDVKSARASLDRAVAQKPYDAGIRTQRAAVLAAVGDDAAGQEAALAAALKGDPIEAAADLATSAAQGLRLTELVHSFAVQTRNAERRAVVSLGVRRPSDWKSLAERFLHPRAPDLAGIETALEKAIAEDFRTIDTMAPRDAGIAALVDELYAFEDDVSLSAQSISRVNSLLGVDGIVVTQLWTRPQDPEDPLCAVGDYEIHMRLLMGTEPEVAAVLANVECLAGGHSAYGRWNSPALGVIGLLSLVLLFPLLRGWGTAKVDIQLPKRTKGFFSIHINEKPDMVVREVVDKNTMREKTRSKRRFDLLRRFQRHMASGETYFRWIPARKTPYTVTVAGPLLDAKGGEIIGHFFQEQPLLVRRGKVAKSTFDFRPQECAVELSLFQGGIPAVGARCALRGDPSSLRYGREGVAFVYVGLGSHVLVVTSEDSAAEIPLEVVNLEASIPLSFDFADGECAFQDCPAAVEPFVLGDLSTAIAALTSVGQNKAAHRLRASLLSRDGRAQEAAAELEAAGETWGAAELRAEGEDFGGSAELFERAGDLDRAAEAHRAAGQLADAARCYEQVFDYANALECWREIGDSEREMFLLEKTGEFMDAAAIAHELGDSDRALTNLQQIDSRHVSFGEACDLIANILIQRGEYALAITKFEEALEVVGAENIALKTLEDYAAALEEVGRIQEALSAFEAVARRDVTRGGVNRRIESLRDAIGQTTAPTAPPYAEPAEARYEILEEIGRGGMGVVYKARDKHLGREVALKQLPETLREHPNAVELFEREARAAAALNHINIVTLFDAGQENGSYFISMELLEGKPLNAILDRVGLFSAHDVCLMGTQIAAGLQYAHDKRIVHRDIKTANLFFTRDRTIKIMDFGIAKSLEEVRRSTTVIGGTPYYMAPEQAAGQAVDHRADLYALGVTLFQLATGTLPFPDGDVTYRHRHEEPPDPREFVATLPDSLANLIMQLMAKDPEDRPQSAAAVARSLRTP